MKIIAAMGANRVIGKNNSLPWGFKEYPEDLANFKKLTANGKLVFGANTFKGLSGSSIASIVQDRTIYVLTHDPSWMANESGVKKLAWGRQIFTVQDIDEIPIDAWICGGTKVYESLLHACDEIYLTRINKEYTGDTFFPSFEDDFELVEKISKPDLGMDFCRYLTKYRYF